MSKRKRLSIVFAQRYPTKQGVFKARVSEASSRRKLLCDWGGQEPQAAKIPPPQPTQRHPIGCLFALVAKLGFARTPSQPKATEVVGSKAKTIKYCFCRSETAQSKAVKERVCRATRSAYATVEGLSNPTSATKKDSIVDTISAMEFCFIYEKCLYFALKSLISVVLRAFFLISTINPPTSAPHRQKWRILYRSRVQSFKD